MRTKWAAVVCMTTLILTACALSPADLVESSVETTGEEAGLRRGREQGTEQAKAPDTEQAKAPDTEQAKAPDTEQAKVPDTEQADAVAQALYDQFINEDYACTEGDAYVIYDADGDGNTELYIDWSNSKSGYIIIYKNGGLCIRHSKEFPSEVNGLQWIKTETLDEAENRQMAHSGIYAHVQTEGGWERYWYPNETDFVAACGFEGTEPFFSYCVPEGQKILTLYYDEATQRGCGIRYYERDPSTFTTTGMYGFSFEGLAESEESGILEDYLKPESFDGSNGFDEVEELKENTEYDVQGRISHYDAAGILTFLAENNTKPDMVLWIDYEYYDNGNLKSRSYYHNGYIFGTWYTTWNCYFDIQGRIAYEDIYITHGSWDTYYIYKDDTKEPAYILDLDNNSGEWIPMLRRGK